MARAHSRSARTSARWRARRPESASICVRQLKPSASRGVSGSAARRAGSSSSSATACEMASCPRSAPKLPARPQQPDSFLADRDAVALHDPTVRAEAQDGLLVAVWLADGRGCGGRGRPVAVPARPRGARSAPAAPRSRCRRGAPRAWSRAGPATRRAGHPAAAAGGPRAASWRRTAPAPPPAHRRPAPEHPASVEAPAWPCPAGPVVCHVRPQHTVPPGEDDLEAGCLQHPHRGMGDVRRQVVVEGVRPEDDAAARTGRGGVGRDGRPAAACGPG